MKRNLQTLLVSALLLGSGSCMAAVDIRQVVDSNVKA